MSQDQDESEPPRLARRALLGTGAAAAAGAGGIVVAGASAAEAADGDPVLAGRSNSATATTTLTCSGATNALRVHSTNTTTAVNAIVASSTTGHGIVASSTDWSAGRFTSQQAIRNAVWAENASTTGDTGTALLAVHRAAGTGTQGATAIRGIQGPAAVEFLYAIRSTFAPGAGEFAGPNGIIGASNQDGGIGVIGHSETGTGVHASTNAPGVDALFSAGNATIAGDLAVQGMISKFGGSFRIDHPLDPQNQYLSHSFVESPDMKNVYDGVVETNDAGAATIELPDWFETLNRDFRYQLTPIGSAAPDLHVASEVADNRFSIAGARPQQRVCWLVTGIRKDTWADENRIPVEHPKAENERGTYLYPPVAAASQTS